MRKETRDGRNSEERMKEKRETKNEKTGRWSGRKDGREVKGVRKKSRKV